MTFGDALEALKQGKLVAREGWNGKGMWLFLAQPDDKLGAHAFQERLALPHQTGAGGWSNTLDVLPTICMKTADNRICVGWLASQTDMLSDDWTVVEGRP